MNYDLSHLTQTTRRVYGPVQDDEALLLYALIRCAGISTVLEVGGQTGYSARNFLAAVGESGTVYTVDIAPVPRLAENHVVIQSDIATVDLSAIGRCGLVFYDAHACEAQFNFHWLAVQAGVIDSSTTVVVHDTGLHREQFVGWAVPHGDRWAHQPEERRFIARLWDAGYEAVNIHANDDAEPRHGLTILQMLRRLT